MTKATDAKMPRALTREIEDLTTFTLKAALKAGAETDSAQFDFATSVAFMMLDSNARGVARGDAMDEKNVKKRCSDVWFAFQLRSVIKGQQVWQSTASDVKAISEMAGKSQIDAAREHCAGSWVMNGEMLASNIHPDKDSSGKYAGAVRKSMVGAYQKAHKLAFWLTLLVAANHADIIRGFAETIKAGTNGDKLGTLNPEHAKAFAAWVKENIAATYSDLEVYYKSGKPVKAAKPLLDRMKGAVAKLSLEELSAFAAFVEHERIKAIHRVGDANEAAGLNRDGTPKTEPATNPSYEAKLEASQGGPIELSNAA